MDAPLQYSARARPIGRTTGSGADRRAVERASLPAKLAGTGGPRAADLTGRVTSSPVAGTPGADVMALPVIAQAPLLVRG
jgi:hypothetical protein